MLQGYSMNMDRLPEGYNFDECRQQVSETALSSLLHFYSPEEDHNLVLLYKIERTGNFLSEITHWWGAQSKDSKYDKITLIFVAIWANITQVPKSMLEIFPNETLDKLITSLVNQLGRFD